MARPKGTGKPPGEKYVVKLVRWPPELWARIEAATEEGDRAAFIRAAVERALPKGNGPKK
jgi:hypothetical protein